MHKLKIEAYFINPARLAPNLPDLVCWVFLAP